MGSSGINASIFFFIIFLEVFFLELFSFEKDFIFEKFIGESLYLLYHGFFRIKSYLFSRKKKKLKLCFELRVYYFRNFFISLG